MSWLAKRWQSDGAVKPFLEHLQDLRNAVVRSLAAVGIGMAVAFPFAPSILTLLKIPLAKAGKDPEQFLRILEVTGPFSVAVGVIFWSGILLSSPFVVYFIGSFIFPGLTEKERDAVLRFSGLAVALFVMGVCLGYFFVLPTGLKAMFGIGEWLDVPQKDVLLTDYVRFVMMLMLGFGLSFELPVIIVVLGYLGVVTSRHLRDKRRHAIVGCFVAAMLLTPSTDIVSQLIMAVPMLILYEMCIWLIWFKERKAAAQAAS